MRNSKTAWPGTVRREVSGSRRRKETALGRKGTVRGDAELKTAWPGTVRRAVSGSRRRKETALEGKGTVRGDAELKLGENRWQNIGQLK